MKWATREMINEVEGLSALTLHDSHADLFDVLIARLFTLEGTGRGKKWLLWPNWHLHDYGVKTAPSHYIQNSVGLSGWRRFYSSQAHKGRLTNRTLWVTLKKFGFSFSLLLKSWHFCATGFKVQNLHQIALWIINTKKWAFSDEIADAEGLICTSPSC